MIFFSFSSSAQFVKFEQISPPILAAYDFQEINGHIFFAGHPNYQVINQGIPNYIYRTDGTFNGTTAIQTATPTQILDGFIDGLLTGKLNNDVFFNGYDSTRGAALWKTDGTYWGTQLVKDINQLNTMQGSSNFAALPNKLVFSSYDTLYGTEVYVTDGTDSGTFMLKNFDTTNTFFFGAHSKVAFNNKVYFSARQTNGHYVIWETDGTKSGTVEFINLSTHFGLSDTVWNFQGHVYNNKLYFISNNHLFVTDGSVNGTNLLSDTTGGLKPERILPKDPNAYQLEFFTSMGGELYFRGEDVPHEGAELWVTDGTKAGTHVVKDITPGTAGRVQSPLGVLKDSIMFFSTSEYLKTDSNDYGLELWVTNGTAQGTTFLKELDTASKRWPKNQGLIANHFIEYDNHLYFRGLNNSLSNFYIWKTDGTSAGTQIMIDTPINVQSDPVLYNNRMYWFDATSSGEGILWQSGGDSTNTEPIKPIGDSLMPVWNGLSFGQYVIVNNSLVFRAAYGDPYQELWALTTTPLKVISYEKNNLEFTIYPNPANTILKIKTDEQIEWLELLDMNGRRILKTINQELDVSKLSSGTYILKVITNRGAGSSTFLVER